jgi:hypothetical protein
MIRELEMRRRDLNLWHVTRRAILVCDWTTLAIAAGFCSLISQ